MALSPSSRASPEVSDSEHQRSRRLNTTRPQDRQAITEGKEELKELHEQVQEYVGPFDLPDPGEEEQGLLREAVQRAAEN